MPAYLFLLASLALCGMVFADDVRPPLPLRNVLEESRLNKTELQQGLNLLAEWFPEDTDLFEQHGRDLLSFALNGSFPYDASPLLLISQPAGFNSTFLASGVNATVGLSRCAGAALDVAVDSTALFFSLMGLRVPGGFKNALAGKLGEAGLRGLELSILKFSKASSNIDKAAAAFSLIADLYSNTGLQLAVAMLKSTYKWWNWVWVGLMIATNIAIWVASGGALFIAKLALSAESMVQVGFSVARTVDFC